MGNWDKFKDYNSRPMGVGWNDLASRQKGASNPRHFFSHNTDSWQVLIYSKLIRYRPSLFICFLEESEVEGHNLADGSEPGHGGLHGQPISVMGVSITLLSPYFFNKPLERICIYLIDGLHGEVESHELTDRSESGHGGAHGQPGEAHLRDGRVDHPPVSVLLPQTPGKNRIWIMVGCKRASCHFYRQSNIIINF